MQVESTQKLADKMVSNFINNYYETFGVKPKVTYKVDLSIPTLNQIFDCVNDEFNLVKPNNSIDEANRDYVFIKYRAIYYSIAKDFKYSLHSMCMLTNQNHATALHSLRNVKETSPIKLKIIERLKNIKY